MEEANQDETTSPFWLQTSSAFQFRRRRPSSFFFNSAFLLLVLLLIASAIFIFVLIPSLLSFISKVLKPQSVKRSWDSLNLVLVLFALLCGLLSRVNSGEDSSTPHAVQRSPSLETPRFRWYENTDRTGSFGSAVSRLRSSSSYPDLRAESFWEITRNNASRFADDTHLGNYRLLDSLGSHSRYEEGKLDGNKADDAVMESEIKNIEVDSAVLVSNDEKVSSPPLPISSPPSPPRASTVRKRQKRAYRSIERVARSVQIDESPPPVAETADWRLDEERGRKDERKRGSATKEFLTSLKKKKKRQRQKSAENFENILQPASAPPPPPPPPPPPSVFHNLFSSKKSKLKAKKPQSVPPPSPPLTLASMTPKTKASIQYTVEESRGNRVSSRNPPFLMKPADSVAADENLTGGESPLIPIPPPPPPPPFKMPAWKFIVHGDFVRVKSIKGSSNGSDSDGISRNMSNDGVEAADSGDSTPPTPISPIFCPSPDVDTKADNFIARFRAGLELEKMNSMNERRGVGMSKLGTKAVPKSSYC